MYTRLGTAAGRSAGRSSTSRSSSPWPSGRWPRRVATGRSSSAPELTRSPFDAGGHRRGPDRAPRARSSTATGGVAGAQRGGRQRRAVPGLPRRRPSATSSATRRHATGGPAWSWPTTPSWPGWPATRSATCCASSGPTRTTPRTSRLALSLELQRAPVEALGDFRGAVVMLDPRNGEVLALASTPTYDASAITDPATADETFAALRDDEDEPLLPRATLGRYVPGSVFKIVTAIAGLGSGAVSPDDDLRGAARGGGGRPARRGLPRSRDGHHPETGDRALDLARRDRGVVQHLVRPDRPGDRRRGPRRLRRAAGLRCAPPVRPADGRLAGDQRQRRRSPAASSTTSSWPTPPTARPRRS